MRGPPASARTVPPIFGVPVAPAAAAVDAGAAWLCPAAGAAAGFVCAPPAGAAGADWHAASRLATEPSATTSRKRRRDDGIRASPCVSPLSVRTVPCPADVNQSTGEPQKSMPQRVAEALERAGAEAWTRIAEDLIHAVLTIQRREKLDEA